MEWEKRGVGREYHFSVVEEAGVPGENHIGENLIELRWHQSI